MPRRFVTALSLLVACGSACLVLAEGTAASPSPAKTTEAQAKPAAIKNDYSNGDSWLCRPSRQDACAADLTTTMAVNLVMGNLPDVLRQESKAYLSTAAKK